MVECPALVRAANRQVTQTKEHLPTMLGAEELIPDLPDEGSGGRTARAQNPLARSNEGWRWIESYLIPVLVTLLAFSLYLYRLDSQSFWFDELGTLARSGWEGSWLDAIRGPLSIPGTAKPPLSFLITHLSLLLGEEAFVLRLPAALFATLTIPLVYALGKALFAGQVLPPGRCWTRPAQAGLLGALLLAVAPLLIRYGQELRMYAMWVFLSTLSLYLFWRAIRSGAGTWWIAFALVSVLALYTHLFGLLYLAVLALVGLWLLARPTTRDQYPFRAWHLMAALAASLLAYVPMVPFLLKGLGSGEGLAGEPAPSWDLASYLSVVRLFGGGYDVGALVGAGLLLVAVVVLAVRGRAVLLLATMWIALPASLIVVLPFGHELWVRYFLCALPVYLLLVAYGLLAVSEWLGSWLAGRAGVAGARAAKLQRVAALLTAAILVGVLLATSAASTSLYYAESKQNWRDATRLLCSLAQPGERVYVRHLYYRTGVLYYARQETSNPCPLRADDVQVLPKDLAEAFPPGGDEARWLIVPAMPRFLPGGTVEVEIQPDYRFLEPTLFLPTWVPREMAIISPLTFQGVAVVRVVPNEPASIRFWSEEDELDPGGCTLLQWEVDHVREVYLQGEGVVGHGQSQICPRTTTRYELEVIHRDGTVTDHTVEIKVRGP
jgi:4-amino-4-deoxy-L-arabinose transferase-like glycosyltransferase